MPKVQLMCSAMDMKQSDVFSVTDVIKLETNDSSLIGHISTVITRPSGYYMLDNMITKRIVKFDRQGKFLYAIAKQGRAPGEFLSISEMGVDRADRYLYLYDARGRKVICYDARDGRYVRSFSFKYNGYSFSPLPAGHFVFYCSYAPNELMENERYPNFIVTDSVGKIENTFCYFDKEIEGSNLSYFRTVFYDNGSDVYCSAAYNDVVYKINDDLHVEPAYLLDYGNDNQKRNEKYLQKVRMYPNIDFDRNRDDLERADLYELAKMTDSRNFTYYMGYRDKKGCHFLYDKSKRSAIDLKLLKKDLFGHNLYFMEADDECFYIPIPASLLKKNVSRFVDDYGVLVKEAVIGLGDDDNPVIIRVKLKDMDV